ncbi:hypothetical protein F5X98DRAFT_389973 [Xylaria grammica]|nr:hypothetical protein F5X98DRAFT_389973 [Xylaria grammica]
MSNSSSLDPETIISRISYFLAFEPRLSPAPPRAPTPAPADRVSSLGMLDRLPPEITSALLDRLDMQSIARFSRASFLANTFVRSNRACQELFMFGRQALLTLGQVNLIGLHSTMDLHAALRAEYCTACARFGAFIFLLTCERCCWHCISYNPVFRVAPRSEVGDYFGLSEQHVQRLPSLDFGPSLYHCLPQLYYYPWCLNRIPEPLVSIKAARDLGLMVHGSTEKLNQAMARRCRSPSRLIVGQFFQRVPTVSQSRDPLFLLNETNVPENDLLAVGSIPFPSLSRSGRVENGLCCRGCHHNNILYTMKRVLLDKLGPLLPPDCPPPMVPRVLESMRTRARRRESFLDHVKHCYSAQEVISQLEEGIDPFMWPLE